MSASIARSNETSPLHEVVRTHDHLHESASRETLPLPMTAAILCGGKSSRMGRSKSFLPFAGKTMIEHRFNSLKHLFAQVVIVANDPEAYSQVSTDVVKDIIPNRGPLVGILSALLISEYEHTFVIACDMPLVDNKLIRTMAQERHGTDVLVLSHDEGLEPLCGIYSKRCVEPLEESIFDGTLKAMDFLAQVNAKLFPYADQQGTGESLPPYFNVNTPQDYSELLTAGSSAE